MSSHQRRKPRASPLSRALKRCMPPNAPHGVTFARVLEIEYLNLLRASDLAKDLNRRQIKPPMHMAADDPRALYRWKPFEVRPSVHIGQLKLFLSEVQFLTEWGDGATKVVYAGAADGTHIPHLKRLFPHLTFDLYDPRPFNPAVYKVEGITVHDGEDGWFTSEVARSYQREGAKILLVSDIRSGRPNSAACDFEKCVSRDMQMQREWMQIIRPIAGMFKFRLPYSPGATTWLAPHTPEHLKYGIFATQSATELRLISTDPSRLQTYDNTDIEEKAYYFNNFTRTCQYRPELPQREGRSSSPTSGTSPSPPWAERIKQELGLDDCWDCCAMREVCSAYLAKRRGHPGAHELVDEKELYGFIGDALRNCGKRALDKLKCPPHGDYARAASELARSDAPQKTEGPSPPTVQWFERMRRYERAPIYSSKEKTAPVMDSDEEREVRALYAKAGHIAPPLGVYAGTLPRAESSSRD